MALRVLDGNQTATTLSSVITGGEHIVAHTVVSLGSNAIADITSAISGSVVTIPSLARIGNSAATEGIIDNTLNFIKIGGHQDGSNQTAHIVHVSAGGAMKVDASGSSVTFSTIAGTVTAMGYNYDELLNDIVPIRNGPNDERYIPIGPSLNNAGDSIDIPISGTVTVGNSVTIGSLPAISGTVTANVGLLADTSGNGSAVFPVSGADVNTIRTVIYSASINTFGDDAGAPVDSSNPLPISGTVTAAAPNGSLTTRFGTPTTANVSFATSAVTNANRKYLLIQNVTTGSNVITVGIGFTPTTTQGIQLTAGAGITFESSYIPTGQIFVLSSVTASNFTILEA